MLIILLNGCDKPSAPKISTQFNAQEADGVANAPYLLPMCFDGGEPQELTIAIHGVGTDGIEKSVCSIAHDENKNNLDFALRWTETKMASKEAWVAEVNVSAENVFSDKDKNRDQLKKSFRAFQLLLSEAEENGCLAKGDAQIISQHVADALPLRLDEILAYTYGFDSNDRIIDLKAGMRLRIEQGAYQFIDPQDDASASYVGRGSSYLQIIRRPDQTLAFDPFLGALKAVETDPPLGRNRMISGAMGLTAEGVSRRYARLVYPSQYPTTGNTTAVQAEDELPMRVGLLLADSAQDLEAATEMYVDSSGCAANEKNSVMCFYFSGRSFVIPEVLVKIQGVEKYVSIGTTMRDALNRRTGASIQQIGNLRTSGYSPELLRWLQPGLCQDKAGYQSMGIVFEPASPITESTLSQWDIPLLMGDELRW
jgi:hypothetical protein